VIATPYTCRVASIYESKLVDFWTKLNDVVHKKMHSYPRVMRLATTGIDVSEKSQNLPLIMAIWLTFLHPCTPADEV